MKTEEKKRQKQTKAQVKNIREEAKAKAKSVKAEGKLRAQRLRASSITGAEEEVEPRRISIDVHEVGGIANWSSAVSGASKCSAYYPRSTGTSSSPKCTRKVHSRRDCSVFAGKGLSRRW